MSRSDTFARTRDGPDVAAGQTVRVGARRSRDVDTVAEAAAVAGALTGGHFLRAWQDVR